MLNFQALENDGKEVLERILPELLWVEDQQATGHRYDDAESHHGRGRDRHMSCVDHLYPDQRIDQVCH